MQQKRQSSLMNMFGRASQIYAALQCSLSASDDHLTSALAEVEARVYEKQANSFVRRSVHRQWAQGYQVDKKGY